ncbi:MAG TPA: hypothetical protein VFZ61_16355 [Polyangiales bacterium]
MRNHSKLQGLLGVTALLWSAPSPGHACSRLPLREWHGYPHDGAENVPVDAVPVYWSTTETPAALPFLPFIPRLKYEGVSATLRDERDQSVALRPLGESQSRFFEIVPQQPLEPSTRYTLVLKFTPAPAPLPQPDTDEVTVHFTTGLGLDADDGSPPQVSVSHYHATAVTSCDPGQTATCIGLAPDQLYVWNVMGEERGGTSRGPFFTHMRESPVPSFDCLEVRRRSPSGRLSQPALACESDGPRYELDLLEVGEDEHVQIGCDLRGVLANGEEAGKLLDAKADEDAAPETSDEEEAVDTEDSDDDAEVPSGRMPTRRRSDQASCSALAPSSMPSWSIRPFALALLALALWRRRQG